MKRKLHIDIETFCNYNVTEVGVYRYTEDPSCRIIIFSYGWDDGPVIELDTHNDEYPGESIPPDVWQALITDDPDTEIWAHNANFEFMCISRLYKIKLHIHRWRCTMVASAYLGLPLGLDHIGKVLKLSEQKDKKGKTLIDFFCSPNKSRKKKDAGLMVINLPEDHPEKWADFVKYCGQDVRSEREIEKYCLRFPPLPDIEWQYWFQDQEINGTGMTIDVEFIRAAVRVNRHALEAIHHEMVELTGVWNPNSGDQLKDWLKSRDCEVKSLDKDYLADSIDKSLLPKDVARLLELRQMGSRTSTTKYDTMLLMRNQDNRIRGLIQFYGANRTGRAAGRGVQPQNLKKTFSNDKVRKKAPHLIDDGLVIAKQAVIKGVAQYLYDDVPEVISKLVRTSFISAPGRSLVVSDFAQIEARVLPWIVGEEWALNAHRAGIDIYAAAAANMFNLPLEMCGKGSDLRPKGKVGTLALGYQGNVGALIKMGALREGLRESELPGIVVAWRNANPKTVRFWRKLEDAFRHVVKTKGKYTLKMPYCNITIGYLNGNTYITLPSGRNLWYYGAYLQGSRIKYWGLDQVKKIWVEFDAYGGLLTENITQAIARDCLYDAMYRMRYKLETPIYIRMHVHDEIIAEEDDDKAEYTLQIMNGVMAVGPAWAEGLPLEGDGYISKFYKKDG